MKKKSLRGGTFLTRLGSGGLLVSFRELVFGLEDGMVSTLGVVVGMAAGTSDRAVVLLSGAVVIVVEAFSMAAGAYLSNKSERELDRKILSEEEAEIRRDPAGAQAEANAILKRIRYTDEERRIVMRRLGRRPGQLLEFIAYHKLKISEPEPGSQGIVRAAAVMWLAYAVGGSASLVSFITLPMARATAAAVAIVAVALFAIGAAKGKLLGRSWFIGGFEMLVVSLGAAGVGHVIGSIARNFLP